MAVEPLRILQEVRSTDMHLGNGAVTPNCATK